MITYYSVYALRLRIALEYFYKYIKHRKLKSHYLIYLSVISFIMIALRIKDPPDAKPPKKESAENFSNVTAEVSGFHSRLINR